MLLTPQDSELTELKDTIEILKAKNTEAQEIIQGALSNPDITPKGKHDMLGVKSMIWTDGNLTNFPPGIQFARVCPGFQSC